MVRADKLPLRPTSLWEAIGTLRRDVRELRAADPLAVRLAALTPVDLTPYLANGWTWTGSTWAPPTGLVQLDGSVLLDGSLAPGTLAPGTVIASLPWAPLSDREFRVPGGAATAAADLLITAGVLSIESTTGTVTRISLTGIRLPA
jgi:hypothetical protein